MATRARYNAGINWCHFEIQVAEMVATFRLHMDENVCWRLFETLSDLGDQLQPLPGSSCRFRWGCAETYGQHLCARFGGMSGGSLSADGETLRHVPEEWQWLERVFADALGTDPSGVSQCYRRGVRLHAFGE